MFGDRLSFLLHRKRAKVFLITGISFNLWDASSDEWCRISDAIVEGLLWAQKIVDDILIWAPDIFTLQSRINEISIRSMKLNVVLSRKKFVIGEELPFAGYIVSKQGVCYELTDPTSCHSH